MGVKTAGHKEGHDHADINQVRHKIRCHSGTPFAGGIIKIRSSGIKTVLKNNCGREIAAGNFNDTGREATDGIGRYK